MVLDYRATMEAARNAAKIELAESMRANLKKLMTAGLHTGDVPLGARYSIEGGDYGTSDDIAMSYHLRDGKLIGLFISTLDGQHYTSTVYREVDPESIPFQRYRESEILQIAERLESLVALSERKPQRKGRAV